jgi:PPK2 family polyphosphate:nucleotide phosphotransferase
MDLLTIHEQHRLSPGQRVTLAALSTSGKDYFDDKNLGKKTLKELREELIEWQVRFYAEGKRKLLVVFQALDAGGKDGTTRAVFEGVNPQGVQVSSFKAPSKEELSRDFLWRVHQRVPAAGMIGVFNRSHYEDVLVVRVEQLVPEEVWRPRYQQINEFEKLLADSGTTILKFYLHISSEEQKKGFQDRLTDPTKRWKFSPEDLKKREDWDAYWAAYDEALTRCTTPWAPWYVVPADQNWYRNLVVASAIVATMRQLDPQYPIPEVDWDNVEIT